VRIMIGCDKFCSYCVVPSTEVLSKAVLRVEILSEVKGTH